MGQERRWATFVSCIHRCRACLLQLYCQNLSLFGKLFIDMKTLFFDAIIVSWWTLSPFSILHLCLVLFYILTDAKSAEDHILGFFSKVISLFHPSRFIVIPFLQEKLSYDDYNLACIMTLPQYQRMGYGMLMIEFSMPISCILLFWIWYLSSQVMNFQGRLERWAHLSDLCQTLGSGVIWHTVTYRYIWSRCLATVPTKDFRGMFQRAAAHLFGS